jgi:hypothetical protein
MLGTALVASAGVIGRRVAVGHQMRAGRSSPDNEEGREHSLPYANTTEARFGRPLASNAAANRGRGTR